jgi:4-hydroxybenzoate polyprenyltransferase
MSILRAAILLAVLAAPAAARAATLDDIAAKTSGAAVAQTFADALISRRPLLVDEEAAPAAQNYFDYDALLTMGALALAVAAFAAFARRPRDDENVRAQTDSVVRWMQNDLARSVARSRDAA